MKTKELNNIVKELITNKSKFGYRQGYIVDEFLTRKKLSEQEYLYVLNKLVDERIFRWYDLICLKLDELASPTEEFISFLQKVIEKIKNDMAQCEFNKVLINLGQDRERAEEIYALLIKKPISEDIYHYSGLLLGGIGKKDDTIIDQCLKNLKNDKLNLKHRTSMIAATQVILESDKKNKHKAKYENILKYSTSYLREESIRLQSVILTIEYYKLEKQKIEFINNLLRKPTDRMLQILIDRINYRGLGNHKLEFEIVEKTLDFDYEGIIQPLCYFVASKNKHNKKISFEIVKR